MKKKSKRFKLAYNFRTENFVILLIHYKILFWSIFGSEKISVTYCFLFPTHVKKGSKMRQSSYFFIGQVEFGGFFFSKNKYTFFP